MAFLAASCFTALELITGKYPRTWFIVVKDRLLFLYAGIYGVIAASMTFGLDQLVAAGLIKLEGLGLSSVWIKAFYVGVGVKAFFHINVANVGSTPIGLEIFVRLFEPHLLRAILFNEFNGVRAFVAPYAAKYADLAVDKARVKHNIPPSLPPEETAAFENEIDKAQDVTVVLERFLKFVGRGTFARVFPLA